MPPTIPIATYRLQLTADFDFDVAAAVVPYLKALGISHLYASPFMKARKGSTHGYDIVDHTTLNPELGGEDGFERLSRALKQHDIGLILDFVPNHVGVHFADNPWWLDVLEWGPASPHAASFDIDWDLLPHRARAGVLLPIIGSSYGEALEKGEIELRYDPGEGSFSAWYFEHRLPIAPERYSEILRNVVKEAGADGSRAGSASADAGAASSAGAPALPARTLAACVQRYQLPAVFRHQYAGGIAGRGCRHVRGDPSAGQKADRGGKTAGPAARSYRRPARSRAVFPAPAPPGPRRAGRGRQPVLYGDRENPRRARKAARVLRRPRHHRL